MSPPALEEVFLHFILVVEEANPHPSVLSDIFYTGEPDSIHWVNRSPVEVALILVLILFLPTTGFGIGDSSGFSQNPATDPTAVH
ncbi:hypothetical protein Q3G72_026723 [Acer saccharum]|nr:hypothetical protein Q3G72_026723 [Acer saccharum]